jgi:hypothetical protein
LLVGEVLQIRRWQQRQHVAAVELYMLSASSAGCVLAENLHVFHFVACAAPAVLRRAMFSW